MSRKIIFNIIAILILPALAFAAATDYLILEDIGSYKLFTGIQGEVFSGPPSKYSQTATGGVLTTAGHFYTGDVSYETSYTEVSSKWPFVEVEVTQHADSPDSLKWLLHEVEDSYRDNDDSDKRLGLLSGAGIKVRDIGGNKFIYWGLGGGSYTWMSGQKVIEIKYTDLQRTKPEPIAVIQAYLQKHPSTIQTSFVFDQAHDVQWIKDEMDRRLWLCDKWFMQLQLKKVEEKQVYQESVKSMNIFLDYREKYYGIKAADEKNLLAGYLSSSNGTSIKAKLAEYKSWWSSHKTGAISLP